ncbi:MFS transporter [Kutzneria kofuensis]|uniref:MFS family permease n=1 Tax=Kutzneria kofuensis TaxID=103725 RepID=A0A7W9NED1_9PSEU|nr:MFS transporter [Kutzneria kofuensis]MBB5889284.1 MFS family permease [Kutzneria kofuensis]
MSTPRLLAAPGFRLFWASDTVSMTGSYVTTVAVPLLALNVLHATGTEFGLLRASTWLPYLLFGLLAGVLVDRCRRKPILIGADLIRFALMGMIPLLAALDRLTMPVLIVLTALIGVLSLAYDAAHQSFLPRLVPTSGLAEANARLLQTNSAAQVAGPALAGALVQVVGAAAAVLVDAASFLVSGLLLARVRVEEPLERPESRNLWQELREGLSWVYRHRMLAPLALTGNVWFFFNAVVTTVLPLYLQWVLHVDSFAFGVLMAVPGAGGVIGALVSTRTGRRFGTGPTIVAGHWLAPLGYLLIPLAGNGIVGLVLVGAAQFVFGFSIGLEGPVAMGYRQAVTPDRLQGRMNATMRSLNRGAIVLGAPLGGVLADWVGIPTALWVGIAGLTVQAVASTLSPLRTIS